MTIVSRDAHGSYIFLSIGTIRTDGLTNDLYEDIVIYFSYSNRWNIKNGPTDCGEPPILSKSNIINPPISYIFGFGELIIFDLLKMGVMLSKSDSRHKIL